MKNLKGISLAVIFMVSYISVSAKVIAKNDYRVNMENAVKSFISGVCLGNVDEFNKVIDDNATISLLRGNRIVNYSKKEQLKELKSISGVVQNCETTYKIIEERENYALVKVEMAYENFVKVNYLTMKLDSGKWSISQVSSVFN